MMTRAAQGFTSERAEQAAEMRLDQVGEVPGDEQRDDPRRERHGLAQEAAQRAHDRRNDDGGNYQVVGRVHRYR